MDRQRGFTLAELVFTLAIVAGLLGWGLPTFRDAHRNAERSREVNQLVHAVHFARNEAIKRNGVVNLCPSTDGQHCAPAGTPWHAGWIVFVNGDRDTPAERDPFVPQPGAACQPDRSPRGAARTRDGAGEIPSSVSPLRDRARSRAALGLRSLEPRLPGPQRAGSLLGRDHRRRRERLDGGSATHGPAPIRRPPLPGVRAREYRSEVCLGRCPAGQRRRVLGPVEVDAATLSRARNRFSCAAEYAARAAARTPRSPRARWSPRPPARPTRAASRRRVARGARGPTRRP